LIAQTVPKNEVHFTVFEDLKKFQKDIEKLRIQRMPFMKCNSVIQYKHTIMREKVIQWGILGLNQAEIADKIGCSLSTVKREIWAIREGLV